MPPLLNPERADAAAGSAKTSEIVRISNRSSPAFNVIPDYEPGSAFNRQADAGSSPDDEPAFLVFTYLVHNWRNIKPYRVARGHEPQDRRGRCGHRRRSPISTSHFAQAPRLVDRRSAAALHGRAQQPARTDGVLRENARGGMAARGHRLPPRWPRQDRKRGTDRQSGSRLTYAREGSLQSLRFDGVSSR